MLCHQLSRRLSMLLLCLLAVKGLLIAQDIDERNFIRYTQQDGLSHDVITSVTQDSTGYIWMSTFFGVNRFDGSHFVQINNTSDSASMQPDYLRGMIWLDRRRLAVYSDGLHIFDTYTGKIQSLFIPCSDRKYQYKYNGIRSVQTDAAGDIFILTYSGFYHFDKEQRLVFRYDHYAKEPISGTNFAFGRNIFWLDARRLVTTELYVIPPRYVEVAVAVGLRVKPGYGVDAVRSWVEKVIRQYLAPLPPYGPEGQGWPLGRRVHAPELEAAVLQVEGVQFVEADGVAVARLASGSLDSWVTGTVELGPNEVPVLAAITVVQGPRLEPGAAFTPPPSKTPIPVPTVPEEC